MRIKYLSTFIAMLLIAQTANATAIATSSRGGDTDSREFSDTAKPTHFIVNLKDGKNVSYALADYPRVVTDGNVVKLIVKGVTVEYPLENVAKFFLGSELSSIKLLTVESGVFSQTASGLSLLGFTAGAVVKIFSANGSIVKNLAIDPNGQLVISLAQYPSGVYIVKVEGETFKFIKR